MKTEDRKKIPYWIMTAMAIGGALVMFFLSGCGTTYTGGYWCSPPINCIEVHGKIEPPPVIRNLYDMTHKPSRDPAGLGFIQYNPIGKPECRLNRRVRVEISGQAPYEMSCNLGRVFAQYYIPVEEVTSIKLQYLSVEGKILDERIISMRPDIYMRTDKYNEEYGWYIIIDPNFRVYWVQ